MSRNNLLNPNTQKCHCLIIYKRFTRWKSIPLPSCTIPVIWKVLTQTTLKWVKMKIHGYLFFLNHERKREWQWRQRQKRHTESFHSLNHSLNVHIGQGQKPRTQFGSHPRVCTGRKYGNWEPKPEVKSMRHEHLTTGPNTYPYGTF